MLLPSLYHMIKNYDNIVFIGMPGSGKSTLGRQLAEALQLPFLDTDRLLECKTGLSLAQFIGTYGIGDFLNLESSVLSDLLVHGTVIATGGSAVYHDQAMLKLRSQNLIIFLDVPLPVLEARLGNFNARGVVMEDQQSLSDLYTQRLPLYHRYADLVLPMGDKDEKTVLTNLLSLLSDLVQYHANSDRQADPQEN